MPEAESKMRPLGEVCCPECMENGEISVVMFEVDDDGVIRTLKCRNCGFEDKPGEFDYE